MKEFTFSDVSRRSGDVLETALVETVSLVKRGKARVVMMPVARYERLVRILAKKQKPPRAFTLANAPAEDIENLMAGFQEIADEAERAGK